MEQKTSARLKQSDFPSFDGRVALPDAAVDDWHCSGPAALTAIDAHAHVFQLGLPLVQTRRHAPDYDATLDAYVAHLRRSRISHSVLVQPSFLGYDNTFLLDMLKRYPFRLRGIATV